MSCQPILRDTSQPNPADISVTPQHDAPTSQRRAADAEMSRVLKTRPVNMASDPSSGAITFWKHDPLHDIVGAMADHVIMAFPEAPARFERRSGKEFVTGTARSGTALDFTSARVMAKCAIVLPCAVASTTARTARGTSALYQFHRLCRSG